MGGCWKSGSVRSFILSICSRADSFDFKLFTRESVFLLPSIGLHGLVLLLVLIRRVWHQLNKCIITCGITFLINVWLRLLPPHPTPATAACIVRIESLCAQVSLSFCKSSFQLELEISRKSYFAVNSTLNQQHYSALVAIVDLDGFGAVFARQIVVSINYSAAIKTKHAKYCRLPTYNYIYHWFAKIYFILFVRSDHTRRRELRPLSYHMQNLWQLSLIFVINLLNPATPINRSIDLYILRATLFHFILAPPTSRCFYCSTTRRGFLLLLGWFTGLKYGEQLGTRLKARGDREDAKRWKSVKLPLSMMTISRWIKDHPTTTHSLARSRRLKPQRATGDGVIIIFLVVTTTNANDASYFAVISGDEVLVVVFDRINFFS